MHSIQSHFSQHSGATILSTAVINIVHADDNFPVRALLDGESERSFITKRIQQMLSLPVSTYRTQISGLGGTIVGNSNLQCLVNIKSNYSAFKLQINNYYCSTKTCTFFTF